MKIRFKLKSSGFLTKCPFVIVYRLVKETAASIFTAENEDKQWAAHKNRYSVQHSTVSKRRKKYVKNVRGKIRCILFVWSLILLHT